MTISMEKHKYDLELIADLCKRGAKKRVIDIAKEYCDLVNIDYSENVRKRINNLVVEHRKAKSFDISELEDYKKAKKRKVKKDSKRFIVTYAQSHTPINDKAFNGMEAYAKEIGADIIIIPGVYSVPNSSYKQLDTGWHPRVIPYMHAREDKLHKFLTIISDANVLPTAERPLRGFEGVTGEESSIVGHPRHHIEVVPTLPQSRDKFLMTTGAITVPNYRDARVGKKAKFHHQIGFLVVEVFDKEHFNFRQVSCDKSGGFQDLMYVWDGKKLTKDGVWDTVVLGDLHLGHHDVDLLDTTMDVAESMDTKYVVTHDIFDGRSVNHHAEKDFVQQVINEKQDYDRLETELEEMVDWLDDWSEKFKVVVVPSNHNDWLDRWVRGRDSKVSPKNAVLFNKFRSVLYNEEAPRGLVAHVIDEEFKGEVITLHRDDSFKRKGHELNNHGDLGSNGAKGTPNTFKKLNVKIVSGDKHFLYTLDGAYGVGVSSDRKHGYNSGLSSWTVSHGVINGNGKFQHLIYVDGKFSELF